jgi:hypothetical protein
MRLQKGFLGDEEGGRGENQPLYDENKEIVSGVLEQSLHSLGIRIWINPSSKYEPWRFRPCRLCYAIKPH